MRTRLLVLPVAALAFAVLAGCSSGTATDTGADSSTAPTASSGACTYTEASGGVRDVTAPPSDPTVSGDVDATIATSAGDINVVLDADTTPCTVNSFVSLAQQKYYDDTTCHRLTTQGIFVLQCGDPSGTGMGGPGYSYPDELSGSETYPAGTIAMANAGPDTNGSQFFLVYEDTQLSPDYTVFGTVDEAGLKVLQGIAAAGVEGGAADGAPATPVSITNVTIK